MRTLKLTMILLVAGLVGCPRTDQLEEEIRQKDLQIESLESQLRRAVELVAVGDPYADDIDALIDQIEDLAERNISLTEEILQLMTERDGLKVEIKKLQAERQQLETEQRAEQ